MEPVPLFLAAKKALGEDFILWDPLTRAIELSKLAKVNNLAKEPQNMLEAMVTLYVTNSPWKDYQIFEKVTWALAGYVPNMWIMEVPNVEYMAYAISIMNVVRKNEPISDEVKNYIASKLLEEGFCVAPPILSFTQPILTLFTEDKNLINKTMKAWEEIKNNSSEFTPNFDDPVSVQLSKLLLVEEFLKYKSDKIAKEISTL